METIRDISEYTIKHPSIITIGTFDGVHVGHQKILERLTRNAKASGLKSILLTFFPHPRMVLQKDTNIKLLNTLDERISILDKVGLDYTIIHLFTKQFSRMTALEFVRDLLVNALNAKKIVIGYDHRFGRNRNANINDLKNYGATFDFGVEEIPVQEIDAVSVSSTKIRKCLLEGNVDIANSYLGYEYMLTGTIQKGKGLGREIGFPTANLAIPEPYKLQPQNGVYAVKSTLNGKEVGGMMNIGFNPTVSGNAQKNIEVHYFDFEGNLYDKTVAVRLVKKIRDEHKFNSLLELSEQLKKDRLTALSAING